MKVESFCSIQNISGESQQNRDAAFSYQTVLDEGLKILKMASS